MSQNKFKPLSRKSDIVIQELDNEILIYNLATHKAFSLNETSALVWQACDGNNTIDEISAQVGKKVNSPISEDFVWLALEQLKQEDLLANETAFAAPFEGLTRREVIRRVGFATMAAIPVIASLVAPSAAHAQSCPTNGKPNNCPCTANGQCTSKCCGGTPDVCVAFNSEPTGSICRANNCECASNCCGIGLTCVVVGASVTGTPCRVNCECTSGTCSGGTCT